MDSLVPITWKKQQKERAHASANFTTVLTSIPSPAEPIAPPKHTLSQELVMKQLAAAALRLLARDLRSNGQSPERKPVSSSPRFAETWSDEIHGESLERWFVGADKLDPHNLRH